jgi:hypothetical protein
MIVKVVCCWLIRFCAKLNKKNENTG